MGDLLAALVTAAVRAVASALGPGEPGGPPPPVEAFRAAVAKLRLVHEGRGARGVVDGVPVSLTPEGDPPTVRVTVEVPVRGDLRLAPFGLASLGGIDVATGDSRFDGPVQVKAGDPFTACALLDGATRDAALAAIAAGGRLDDRWQATLVGSDLDGERIVRVARTLARAHRALAASAARPPTEAMIAIAEGDRHPAVRVRALDLLVERGIAPRALLEARTKDMDPAVRWRAATALGPDGHDALRALVREGSRSWRFKAAAALPPGDREAEEALIAALDDPELAVVAIAALAGVGTARSIEPLRRIAREGTTVEQRWNARAAADLVASRIDRRAAGGLSLAGAEIGGLSEPQAGGGLAVAPERAR